MNTEDKLREKEWREILKTDPTFVSKKGKIVAVLYGDYPVYPLEVIDFLKEKSPQEVKEIARLARIHKLEKEIDELKKNNPNECFGNCSVACKQHGGEFDVCDNQFCLCHKKPYSIIKEIQ